MRERDYGAVIDLARGFEGIAERYAGDRRRDRLRGALEEIIIRLDCRPPDDLAARASSPWPRAGST